MALGMQQQQRTVAKQCAARSSTRLPRVSCKRLRAARVQATAAPEAPTQKFQRPDAAGRYGKFGGKYVPETLIPALAELETAYHQAMADPAFKVGTGIGNSSQGKRVLSMSLLLKCSVCRFWRSLLCGPLRGCDTAAAAMAEPHTSRWPSVMLCCRLSWILH